MREFEALRPMLEQKLQEQMRLSLEYECLRQRESEIDVLERDSSRFAGILRDYEVRMSEGNVLATPVEGKSGRKKHMSMQEGRRVKPDVNRLKKSSSWHSRYTELL